MSMNMAVYDFGDRLRITGTWSQNETPTSPTTVRWRVRAPNGTETAITASGSGYTLTTDATGVHSLRFTPTAAGLWVVRGEGLGTVEQAFEVTFRVKASAFATASVAP